MSTELMPCPVCGTEMTWSHRKQRLYCDHYAVEDDEITGCYYRSPDAATHNALARRAEIGRLVEQFSTALTLGDETGCDEVMAGQDIDDVELVVTFGAHAAGKHGQGETILDALRALAAKLEDRND